MLYQVAAGLQLGDEQPRGNLLRTLNLVCEALRDESFDVVVGKSELTFFPQCLVIKQTCLDIVGLVAVDRVSVPVLQLVLVEVEYLSKLIQASFFNDFTYLVLLILHGLLKWFQCLRLLIFHFNISSDRKRNSSLCIKFHRRVSLRDRWHPKQVHKEAILVQLSKRKGVLWLPKERRVVDVMLD